MKELGFSDFVRRRIDHSNSRQRSLLASRQAAVLTLRQSRHSLKRYGASRRLLTSPSTKVTGGLRYFSPCCVPRDHNRHGFAALGGIPCSSWPPPRRKPRHWGRRASVARIFAFAVPSPWPYLMGKASPQ